jgi:hypothetical protein
VQRPSRPREARSDDRLPCHHCRHRSFEFLVVGGAQRRVEGGGVGTDLILCEAAICSAFWYQHIELFASWLALQRCRSILSNQAVEITLGLR